MSPSPVLEGEFAPFQIDFDLCFLTLLPKKVSHGGKLLKRKQPESGKITEGHQPVLHAYLQPW